MRNPPTLPTVPTIPQLRNSETCVKLLNLFALPVEWATCRLLRALRRKQLLFRFADRHPLKRFVFHRRTWHVIIGAIIVFAAGKIYEHTQSKEMELTCFGLHGFGAAPIIKAIADAIGMEV